ncbi:hypothetical protein SEA_WEASELS2_29 [Rhodococcus phage Weasels2]|uniref:Uncharacterized protein n=1 Tax=Rhodococcus phage Weasels2 TaxID=1897437 RepID=A0A1I9SA13_9CAUD|nr:hypothetical protein FDH04_gp029 [Rhodococcus phage Weasels2]AOZ63619.1 hypothetical protein SEA_WEASELS2_29 [Rhodococcus phage Weasels2]
MFYDDYDAGRDQGRAEGYYEGIQYAIDLLQSEAAEMWRQDAIRITLAQPTAQKLDAMVKVLKKERDK